MIPLKEFQKSREEMEAILQNETLGFLGVCVDGQPYVVPLTYAYSDGKILFHCAWEGKKLDAIKVNPQVCFTVARQYDAVCPHPQGAQCKQEHESVICYGIARILTDQTERWKALNAFNRAIVADAEEISAEAAASCCAVEIAVSSMTGRRQREGKHRSYWEHDFRNGTE